MNKIGVLLISMLSFGSLMGQSVGMEIKPVRVLSNHEVANTASSMEYGYCGDMYTTIGWPNMEVRMRASIQIPTEIAERFSGVEISKVLVGIGDAETKDAQIFITQSLQNTEHIYVQDVNLEPSVWNEITLDEPYTIDGDEIFIGYELTAGGVGVQNYHAIAVDNENPNKYGDYIGTYSEGEWSDIHLSEVNLGNVCIKLVLTGDNLPQYDMELQSLTVKEYMRTGEEFSISGVVKNFGAKDIGSYNVECQIDQQEPMLFTVSDEVKSNSINQFEIDGLTISEDGVHELRITVVSLDGNEDEYPANNSLTESVTCMSNLANRKVLLEQFSTMSCSNCPAAHTVIEKILSERDDVAWVCIMPGIIMIPILSMLHANTQHSTILRAHMLRP